MPKLDRDRVWRISLLFGLLVLIFVYLWWREHPRAELPPPGATQALTRSQLPAPLDLSAVVDLRLSRDQSQSRSIAELTQIAATAASADARQAAGAQATNLTDTMRIEQETDAALGARGFEAATLITGQAAEVTLAERRLTVKEVRAIAAVVELVTGLPAESIRIVPAG